jgi:hypothetical protein
MTDEGAANKLSVDEAIAHLLAHWDELQALRDAQDGNPFPLSALLAKQGVSTPEAREWIAARLRGEKLRRGAKRTFAQVSIDWTILFRVREIMYDEGVTEHRAVELLCDRDRTSTSTA